MRIHGDGFDHYGLTETFMLDNEYASVGSAVLSTAQFATGTHSIYMNQTDPGQNNQFSLRKVLASPVAKMGAAARFYFPTMPDGLVGGTIFDFLSSAPANPHVSCIVDANGALRFLRGRDYFTINGENGTLIAQTDPLIGAAAWNHIEVQINIDNSVGWVRVAVNGVHRYQALNLDTRNGSDTLIYSVSQSCGITGATSAGDFYMDDYYMYDFTGDSAVDTDWCPTTDAGTGVATGYIGDLQGMYLPANGDTAESDWQLSTGTDAYALVDEVDPDDADFLYSNTVDDLTELEFLDLPEEITYVRGVDFIGRMSKADAGAAFTKFGMKSVVDIEDADERPLTVEASYWRDQFNVDPDSGARWTRASLNAAWLRLIRSL